MLHLAPDSTVVVIGPPGSGKTHVGELLAETSGLPLYSTDTFLDNGAVEALYVLMRACGDKGWIVEGMIGYRLLRKRAQLGMPPPHIVIELEASDQQIIDAYRCRNKHCDIAVIRRFCRSHEKILSDYLLLDHNRPRIWIHANSFHLHHLIGGGPEQDAISD